jgi:murein DD-endopeptidase MepM/ murein hydrolase activator NlpD
MFNRVFIAVLLCGSLALASTITVRPGDTLGGIAARYDTSVATLMRLNGLRNQAITVGQQLRLPSNAGITVQSGDTLDALAKRHGTTVAALRAANGLSSDALRPGQRLRFPGTAASSSPTAVAAPRVATGKPAVSSGVYTVRAGDTLEGIAKRLGTTVDALKAANGLTSDRLRLEQRLRVPGTVQASKPAPSSKPTTVRPSAKPATPVAKPAAAQPSKPSTAAKPKAAPAKPVSPATKPATVSSKPAVAAKPLPSSKPANPVVAAKPAATPPAPTTITVKRGDTLYSVARRVGKSVAELRTLNGLKSDALSLGQRLRISASGVTPPTTAAKPTDKPVVAQTALTVVAPPVPMVESAAAPAPTAPSDMLEVQQEFTIIEPVNPPARINRFERLLWPVSGILTSRFGYRWGRLHTGLDIAIPSGTSVYAALSGTVQFAGWNRFGYGYLVIIRGVDNRDYYYAHNSRLLVQRGQFVPQGRLISRSGSTGNSTGPHLHFEVRIGGVARNPIAYLPSSQVLQARYAGK